MTGKVFYERTGYNLKLHKFYRVLGESPNTVLVQRLKSESVRKIDSARTVVRPGEQSDEEPVFMPIPRDKFREFEVFDYDPNAEYVDDVGRAS